MARVNSRERGPQECPLCRQALPQGANGRIVVDYAAAEIRWGGRIVRFTRLEMNVLYLLARRVGHAVSKEGMLTRLYSTKNDHPDLKLMDVIICKLRRKIRRLSGLPLHIDTIWGYGWRILASPAQLDVIGTVDLGGGQEELEEIPIIPVQGCGRHYQHRPS